MVYAPARPWFLLTRHDEPPAEPVAPETPPAPEPPAEPVSEPLGEPGIEALRKEREARKAAETRAKANEEAAAKLKELEDAAKSKEERDAEERTRLAKERDDLLAENLRLKVATEKALPPQLAARLQGTTLEELQADADELLALVPQGPRVPTPDPAQGSKQPPGEVDFRTATPEEVAAAKRKLGLRSY